MKKNTLIIILLVLIIIIPFGLKISESFKTPLLNRVEKDGFSKKPKDYLWEHVKDEYSIGRINLKINYPEKYKDAILFTLKNATAKDSLSVRGLIKELKKTFPSKKVAHFSDFVGQIYVPLNKKNALESFKGYYYDELVSFTMHLTFDSKITNSNTSTTSSYLKDKDIITNGSRSDKWNQYFLHTEIGFGFEDDITTKERIDFMVNHFFNFMWMTHQPTTEVERDDFRVNIFFELGFPSNVSFNIGDGSHGSNENNEFLIKKIFSNDFKNQFEDYMYTTYPWRYVHVFLDKEAAKQNATAMVTFIGLLILILACSLFWNRKFKASFGNYFWAIFIFSFGFSSLMNLYEYLIHIEHPTNPISALLITSIFDVLIVLVISFLFWQLEKRIVPKQGPFGYQLLIKLALTFIILYVPSISIVFSSEAIVASGGKITRSLNDLQFLFITIGLTLGRGILIYLNHFSESLVKEKDVELSRLKEINTQSELKLLQSHINPHFLYNALNSIAGLVHKSPDKSEKMALSLSNLFRYSINKKGQQMSTVNEEVVMVQNYLDIETIRFGDRLLFTLNIDEALKNEEIPMYILQPLVENAIKHGVSKIRGEGLIALEIKKDLENLIISVSDNGPDFPKGLVSGHGLQTVYDLLRLSYDDKASLHWENTPIKRIEVKIPLKT
jgi:sensor histidine kinase YesM